MRTLPPGEDWRFRRSPLFPAVPVHSNGSDAHLTNDRYGDFRLTGAIRPGPGVPVVPREGYRLGIFKDRTGEPIVPVLVAAASREKLFDIYLEFLEALGSVVDVVLETSYDSRPNQHQDLLRRRIDRSVFASYCCDFEDLLMNDGCTGVAAMASSKLLEVQFDDHKLLMVYGLKLKRFRRILRDYGIERDDSMSFITDGEHFHSSDANFYRQFQQFSYRIGAGELSRVADE
jgi:hypothetical protein